jgi:hypothetical protein
MSVIDCSLSHYLRHERGSIDAIVAFYNAWAKSRSVPAAFHWITYEDMHRDPRSVLRSSAQFFGLPEPTARLLDESVEFASFENMRKTELKDGFKHERLRPADPSNPDSYKVRRGKAGGYVDSFLPSEIEYLDSFIDRHLDPFFGRYLGGSKHTSTPLCEPDTAAAWNLDK